MIITSDIKGDIIRDILSWNLSLNWTKMSLLFCPKRKNRFISYWNYNWIWHVKNFQLKFLKPSKRFSALWRAWKKKGLLPVLAMPVQVTGKFYRNKEIDVAFLLTLIQEDHSIEESSERTLIKNQVFSRIKEEWYGLSSLYD